MGQLKGDGRATNVTVPDTEAVVYGELYRIDGFNGFALGEVAAADTERNIAMEIASDRVWYVTAPAALTGAAKGDLLSWAGNDPDAFLYGLTDLVAFAAATSIGPCAIVEEAPDANDVIGIRVLNVGMAATA